MSGARVKLGWALLFVGGVLAVFLLTTPERHSRHTASEAPIQVCALEQVPSAGPELCGQVTQSDLSRRHTGEAAWLTRC